jgi:hypothetical protein
VGVLSGTNFYGLRAHSVGKYRQETHLGRKYIVVPIVALVEGVLQGMASVGPELALAEEFGRFPASWDGRPVVMNHPVANKKPIPANSPTVLESYQIGTIFNTSLEGNELHQEAWIDVERAKKLNDNSRAVLKALRANQNIEVSTGYFSQIEKSEGIHANSSKKYVAIQRNIAPDHLAFLPNGVKGACSNNDGCGIRDNAAEGEFEFIINAEDCDCGGTCGDCGDHGHNAPAVMTSKEVYERDQDIPLSVLQATRDVFINSFPDAMLTDDVRTLVSNALRKMQKYAYIVGMTKENVIYRSYDAGFDGYSNLQRSYTVGEDGSVTLGETVTEVNLITKVMPVANAEAASEDANDPSEGNTPKDNEDTTMTKVAETTTPAANAQATTTAPKVHKMTNDAGTLEVTFNEKGEPTGFAFTPVQNATSTEKPRSLADLLANAAPELRESIESGVKMHAQRKDGLIKALEDTKRCKFSKEQLSAMSIGDLENMAELAGANQVVTHSFGGIALPTARSNTQNFTPAPTVFKFKANGELDESDDEADAA